jgi:hypothetical protein
MPYLGGVGLEIAVVGHASVGERAALTGGKLEAKPRGWRQDSKGGRGVELGSPLTNYTPGS